MRVSACLAPQGRENRAPYGRTSADTARVAIQGSLQVINGIEEDLDLEGEDSVFQSNGLGLTFVGNPNVIFDIVVERDYSDSTLLYEGSPRGACAHRFLPALPGGLGLIWFLVIVCVGLLLFCGLLVCLCCYCCKPRSAARSKVRLGARELPSYVGPSIPHRQVVPRRRCT